jgi:hypothetical protein
MCANITTDVAQRAEDISGEFGEMGVEIPVSSIEERIAAMQEFSVPIETAVETTVRNVINDYDLESNDLSDGVKAVAGFVGTGNSSSRGFDRIALEDISNLGDEEWVDVRAQIVDLWEPHSESMRQVGLIADETAQMKFVVWAKNTHLGGHERVRGQVLHLAQQGEQRHGVRGGRRTHGRVDSRHWDARRPR